MGVVGTKLGTKAFGQTQERPVSQTSIANTVSATENSKMSGENVGEVLNKVADPNWVDPSKKMRTVGNDKLDKDAFFKLMIAQMKNQDPSNPLKPHEMSAQMATFSSLEQMQNMNTTLNEMKNAQKPIEQFQSLNLIGKAVGGDSAKLVRAKGDREHDFQFSLPKAANDVNIRITNSAGDTVRTYSMKNLKEGENRITWNGLDEKGNACRADEYTYHIEAKDSAGQGIAVKTDFSGVITGVNYTPEGLVLMVGNQTVRLRDVRKILDPGLMKNDQKINNINNPDLKTQGTVTETGKEQLPAAPDAASEPRSNIMNDVALSRDMMERLQKETKE